MILSIIFTASIMPTIVFSEDPIPLIKIRNDGVVVVEMNRTIFVGVNEFKVPVEPISATLETYIDGKLIPSLYVNKTIFVASTINGTAYIRYLANVTREENTFTFHMISNETVELIVEPRVILLSVPENIISMTITDSSLSIIFKGPAEIKYTIAINLTTTPAGEVPSSQATATSVPTETPTTMPKETTMLEWVIVAVIVVAIAIIGVVLFRASTRKRQLYEVSSLLDRTDMEILDHIKNSGGSILQSELLRRMDIPKATLWRHVNKLAKLGFIEIVKEGKANRLILKKYPK